MGLTAGSGGTGITISASVNAAKGHAEGNSVQWQETTLDAGQHLTLKSGRDTTLAGAQASGKQVTANVGRDLTITSQQDTDHYDSSQQSVSAGASFTFGAPGGSGSFSYSHDKMHSTLGFSDIHNQADYSTSHQGAGFSTGGGIAGNLVSNLASTLLSGMGSGGHAEGTTQAAVSQGSIVIRDQSHQQQDISGLQRDVTKANDTVSPIFDKEKEQKRLQTAQLISDVSVQVSDVVRSEGDIAAAKAVRDPGARAAAKLALQNAGIADPSEDQITSQTRNMAQAPYGTGSAVQRGISAATAALSALSGGDLRGALTGAAAPEIAYLIGQHITDNSDSDRKNVVAGAIAHAVVNAALARLSGGDAGAAAAGAATGELVGQLAVALYNKPPELLSEDEKQFISGLSTLASGLAGGLVSNNSDGVRVAAQAGKTTVENNALELSDNEQEEEHEEHERETGNGHIKILSPAPYLDQVRDKEGHILAYNPGLAGPLGEAEPLPSGYSAAGNGNITGPRGGVYTSTGKSDSSGNTIYSNNGEYYIFDGYTKTPVQSPNASNQIRNNYEQGKAFENEMYNKYSATQPASTREITLKTDNGTNVRVDIITKDENGGIACIECKSSPTAPLTKNQTIGYPDLEKNGGTIVGAGKPGFEGGTKIPPTQVIIIRPENKKE